MVIKPGFCPSQKCSSPASSKKPCKPANRIFAYYTKLAMLSIKAYVGKKKQSSKKVTSVGIELGTLGLLDLLCYTLMPS